jgi:hypothetical protein
MARQGLPRARDRHLFEPASLVIRVARGGAGVGMRCSRARLHGSPVAVTDMEGPAVKRSVTAPSKWSRSWGQVPEDAGAQRTRERLRRRIRLICAGCSEEQSRMTPLRRELPPSRGASRSDRGIGRRRVTARALQSCSPHAVVDVARESLAHWSGPGLILWRGGYATAGWPSCRVIAAQMKPTSSRATAATATGERLPWPTRWR